MVGGAALPHLRCRPCRRLRRRSPLLALSSLLPPYLPGSHTCEPSHITALAPLRAAYAASRHSYRAPTTRSTVSGPTSIPLLMSPPHMRFRRSTYRACAVPSVRFFRFARRVASSYPRPPFTFADALLGRCLRFPATVAAIPRWFAPSGARVAAARAAGSTLGLALVILGATFTTPGPLNASDDEAPRYRSSNEGRRTTCP